MADYTMADYKLGNKSSQSVVDEDTLVQKICDRILASSDLIEVLSEKISDKIVSKLRQDLNDTKKELNLVRNQLNQACERIEYLEQFSRKDNLRFYGIPHTQSENTDEIIIKLCREKLNIEVVPSDISVSHRLKNTASGNRPIIARFTNSNVKKNIFNNKSKLKG
ncbi:hypothetical protein QE152_g3460 [Popillia japonica]|uniref:Uncharacterized protein n=1 Tax=Popillia japonica TaxID=7064 RepID=A0AAW1N5V6_POPJA